MKIVIINGSARRGNTLTAIDAFIKGASEKNEIEIIQPDRLHIAPCKGCGACQCYKGCIDQDDTNPTIDKITAADVILFAILFAIPAAELIFHIILLALHSKKVKK